MKSGAFFSCAQGWSNDSHPQAAVRARTKLEIATSTFLTCAFYFAGKSLSGAILRRLISETDWLSITYFRLRPAPGGTSNLARLIEFTACDRHEMPGTETHSGFAEWGVGP